MATDNRPSTSSALLAPFALARDLFLTNRIVMAPMTRCFADDHLAPTERTATYYARRADAGLIISEAVLITPLAQGYPRTPGIYTEQQVAGWRKVTDAVHRRGGHIFCQLWHTGRLSHSHYTGQPPSAPSDVACEGPLPRAAGLFYETPVPFSSDALESTIAAYGRAARNAGRAGFDGVEIHGANGYLIDQFLRQQTNRRDDSYGPDAEGRARFALDVVDNVIAEIGNTRTAIRLSPQAYVNLDYTDGDEDAYALLLTQLNARDPAYVHVSAFDASLEYDYLNGTPLDYIRSRYSGTVIGCGSLSPATAEHAMNQGRLDLAAFGRPFIANPDLVEKIRRAMVPEPFDETMLAEYY
jgi:N-ethylmaleimide reductase